MSDLRMERGAVAITVALCLVVLLGVVAMAVDGGVVYNERRSTQNAADHAALAAAWAECTGEDAIASGQASALANGYDNIKVSITEPEDNVFRAEVTEVENTQFGGVIGTSDVTVLSEAEATCVSTPGGGGYAIFAGATSCGNEIRFNAGPNRVVNGGVHSNGVISVTGGGLTVNGPVTHLGAISDPQGHLPQAQQLSGGPLPYPVDYDIADYRPGGTYSSDPLYVNAGSDDITRQWFTSRGAGTFSAGTLTITQAGIYYTTGNIHLNNRPQVAPGVGVTLIAEGTIHVTGATLMRPYHNHLLMFSNSGAPSCSGSVIQFSMSSAQWEGVVFAPNGECRQSLASSQTLPGGGSIICYTVDLHGSAFDITSQDDGGGPPQYTVELRK